MNIVSARRVPSWVLASAVLFWGVVLTSAQEKLIRLRNETIHTPVAPATARLALQGDEAVSGLLLIQFERQFDAGQGEALAKLGVDLLSYVPDDAFIARLRGTQLSSIRGVPGVRWVGEYRIDHKLHPRLAQWWKAVQPGTERRLNLLLSPKATTLEKAMLARHLRRLDHQAETRFGGLMRGTVEVRQLIEILKSPIVLWVEAAPQPKLVDEVAAEIVAGDGGPGRLYTQSLGFDGADVTVAVADSGLDTGDLRDMHPDIKGRVKALFYYGALDDASDGHSHGTHVTGIVAGNGATREVDENGFRYGLGVAPGASVVAQRIFDAEGGYEAPPTYETLTRDAVRAGADIGSNSWGDDTHGAYDISAAEFDALVRDADALTPGDQQYILEFSAGNAGPGAQTIGSPAVGKNVIASGASQNNRLDLFIYADGIESMADFSSRGPCEDGRIKPDVVAPGTWIASMKSRLASEDNAWGSISRNYIYQGGTSQAGPQVSGAAAVLVQYHKELFGQKPSPALVKALLINSAVDMDDESGTGPVPNDDEGWGRVDLTRVIGVDARPYEWVDQTALLRTGQSFEKRVIVTGGSEEELKITLAYTDVPGFPGAIPALVNDLDLEVVGPDGVIYRGNQFAAGESVPGALAADRINNVEGVALFTPQEGEYIIRVRGFNVAQDSVRSTAAIDQDFALVVSGGIPAPGVAAILLDRPLYTAPSVIQVAVLDPGQAGQPSLEVLVKSSTEPAGETVTLRSSASSLLYTGSVATVTGSPVRDGRLQVAHRDVIEVQYGTVPNLLRREVRADLVPPVISRVSSTNEFGSTLIGWTTDEPADSVVFYGLAAPVSSLTNHVAVTNHAVELSGLVADRPYVYFVVSRDAAGNGTTNNNAGNLFRFTSPRGKTVLLVDAYEPDILLDSIFIPLSSYTQALDQARVSYDVWDRSQRPELKLENLKPYKVVIWRINDIDFGASISAAEITVLSQYLAGGGSFFMSSMEGLSRFNNPTFNTQIAHVESFEEDLEAPVVEGLAGDPTSGGVEIAVNYSNYPDFSEFGFGGPDFSDHLVPAPDAAPLFFDAASQAVVGVRFPRVQDGTQHGRSIFLAFPIDGVPMSGASPNTRPELFRRILNYLAPGADGRGTLTTDNSRYTIRSRMLIQVGDSDLAGQGFVNVKVVSDTDPAGVTVRLLESSEAGLFHGEITLVPVADGPGASRLRAQEADTVRVDYVDASLGVTVTASATIDTIAPELTGAAVVEPDYEEATVQWQTSEASDSLIEFGETTRLGRTAYSAAFTTDHELTFRGLAADRVYFFKVTSRDQAGNVLVDDNGGALYSFRTLTPLGLPWSDDMEQGVGEWTVFDSDGTQSSWTLGVPRNGFETAAHSPQNAWGSVLKGGFRDEVETYLLSPTFNLTGGNRATLRFWHSYDFLQKSELDILIGGEVLLFTNNAAAPVTLLTLGDEQSSWIEEEIDLTPYLGHVSTLAFHYILFSFETARQGGWLIDDVSIDVETIQPAILEVTNNLSQARFIVTGAATRTAQGRSYVDSRVPPGDYVITWGEVPFYRTPPPQTNSLAAGGKLVFRGEYSFEDSNANGISDAWEISSLGTIDPVHPGARDSDGDGQSDLGEFLAGTDPTQAESALRLVPPVVEPGGTVIVSWSATPLRTYRLMESLDLVNWLPVSDWTVGRAGSMSQLIPADAGNRLRLYRVEVLP